MTKTERLLRSVIGLEGRDTGLFTRAVDQMAALLFDRKLPAGEVRLLRDICLPLAEERRIKPASVEKNLARMTRLCWEQGDRRQLDRIIGKSLDQCPTPWQMLIYFACAARQGRPFYHMIGAHRELMF